MKITTILILILTVICVIQFYVIVAVIPDNDIIVSLYAELEKWREMKPCYCE